MLNIAEIGKIIFILKPKAYFSTFLLFKFLDFSETT